MEWGRGWVGGGMEWVKGLGGKGIRFRVLGWRVDREGCGFRGNHAKI